MGTQEMDFPSQRRPRVAQIEIEDKTEFREPKPRWQYQSPMRYQVLDGYAKAVFFTAKMTLAVACGVVAVLCFAFIIFLIRSV